MAWNSTVPSHKMTASSLQAAESGRLILEGKAKLQQAFQQVKATAGCGCAGGAAPEAGGGLDHRPALGDMRSKDSQPACPPASARSPRNLICSGSPRPDLQAHPDHPALVRATHLEIMKKSNSENWKTE